MNKGIIAGVLALAVAAPMTVFAEETTSPSADDARIVIEERAENDGIKVNDMATVVNEKWGTSFDADYVVSFVGEAYVTPEGYEGELTLTINAVDFGGEILVHHKNDGSVDFGSTITLNSKDLSPVIALKKVPSGGDDGKTDPAKPADKPTDGSTVNTGDSNHTGLWTGALIISALLAGAAIVMNKRSA